MSRCSPPLLQVGFTPAGSERRTVGFDPSLAGTPESCWEALERHDWSPEDGPLVVVAPHPDDETLGAGGLIHSWARRRLPVIVVSVTDGEAACREAADLACVRQAELREALRSLSAGSARIIRLGIPDGHVHEHCSRLEETLSSVVSPDTTLIAPFEHDGHCDHDAAGAVARDVARQRGITLASYPIWAWHQSTPRAFSARRIVSFSLSLASRAAKRTAIGCYVSQLRDRPGGPVVPSHVLPYFNRADEVFLV
jgi:LmbE family N-acetylglucosaminyl deacetylase